MVLGVALLGAGHWGTFAGAKPIVNVAGRVKNELGNIKCEMGERDRRYGCLLTSAQAGAACGTAIALRRARARGTFPSGQAKLCQCKSNGSAPNLQHAVQRREPLS